VGGPTCYTGSFLDLRVMTFREICARGPMYHYRINHVKPNKMHEEHFFPNTLRYYDVLPSHYPFRAVRIELFIA